MSLAKAAPDGLKDRKCKKMAFLTYPPIPHVPEKDSVQETVSAYKDNQLKTLINKGTELRVPIWHSGTRKAFLIHVETSQEGIKKNGYFKSYEEYLVTFADKRERIKHLKSQLAELDETYGTSKKSGKKSRKTTVEASSTSSTPLRVDIVAELKQAVEATEEATDKHDQAAKDMFQL